MQVDQTYLEFIRDTTPDIFELSKSASYNYGAFAEEGVKYKTIDLFKQDVICYLKQRGKELWLYSDGWSALKPGLFSSVKAPLVCWIKYMRAPTFVIYARYGTNTDRDTLFFRYNKDPKKIQWVPNLNDATLFAYRFYENKTMLAQSVDLK